MSIASNNSACFYAKTSCFDSCQTTANLCDRLSGNIAEGLIPFSYACIAVGGLYIIKGTTIAAVVFQQRTKKWLENKRASRDATPLNSVDEFLITVSDTPPPPSKKITPLWKSIYNVVHSYTVGALPLTAGVLLNSLPHFIRTIGCEHLRDQCPEFGSLCLNTCNRGNDWLLEALNEFVQQYMQGTNFP